MKIFKSEEYIKMANPTPGSPYRPEILTKKDQAKNLGGMFGLLVPGSQVPYHYHNNRESVIIAISGEAIEVIEGKEISITAGDVLFIPAGEKHTTINRSNRDFRYLEFFTFPPITADFVEVK
jgi:quercetin dioxygenase-like cupin family protein